MNALEVDTLISLELHLLERDKIELRKSIRKHDHASMVKRKDNDHASIRKELEKRVQVSPKIWNMGHR